MAAIARSEADSSKGKKGSGGKSWRSILTSSDSDSSSDDSGSPVRKRLYGQPKAKAKKDRKPKDRKAKDKKSKDKGGCSRDRVDQPPVRRSHSYPP